MLSRVADQVRPFVVASPARKQHDDAIFQVANQALRQLPADTLPRAGAAGLAGAVAGISTTPLVHMAVDRQAAGLERATTGLPQSPVQSRSDRLIQAGTMVDARYLGTRATLTWETLVANTQARVQKAFARTVPRNPFAPLDPAFRLMRAMEVSSAGWQRFGLSATVQRGGQVLIHGAMRDRDAMLRAFCVSLYDTLTMGLAEHKALQARMGGNMGSPGLVFACVLGRDGVNNTGLFVLPDLISQYLGLSQETLGSRSTLLIVSLWLANLLGTPVDTAKLLFAKGHSPDYVATQVPMGALLSGIGPRVCRAFLQGTLIFEALRLYERLFPHQKISDEWGEQPWDLDLATV